MNATRQTSAGEAMHDFAAELFPICRSITGNGVRETLERMQREIPLEVSEIPTGTRVFDWTVPREWNIRSAYLEGPDGRRVVDFSDNTLHVLNYSVPVDVRLSLDDLQSHLYSLPGQPDLIPYRTSYYTNNWGFCLRHHDREALRAGTYRAYIDSDLHDGSLTLGEFFVPGRTQDEVLIYSHICHPSLANDNLSGLAVTVWWARHLANAETPRFGFRFVWGPGTIGSITWLAQNEARLARIRHGYVAVLLGRPGRFRLKQNRRGEGVAADVAHSVLSATESGCELLDFDPYGYDERQFCSPGIDLDVCRLSRAPNGAYPEYHTSADDLDLIDAAALQEALDACRIVGETLDRNRTLVNLSPKGEPQLGKRGLYQGTGGTSPREYEHAMLWVLSQSDGSTSLLDIARRSGLEFTSVAAAADRLEAAGLLEERG